MTTTADMLQDGPGGRKRRRRRAALVALVVVVALVVAAVVYVIVGSHGYYAISPGSAPIVSDQSACRSSGGGSFALADGKPCVRIVLPPEKAASVAGSIMMVDVLVGPATPWDFLLSKVGLLHSVRDGTVLVPNAAILGDTPASQLDCQDTQQMTDATQAARVVALRRLGYTVQENDQGAQIDLVAAGTPAEAAGMQCNDLVTAIDGHPVHTADDLVRYIHALAPGDDATITVLRSAKEGKTKTVELTARLEATPAAAGQAANPAQAFLGVSAETRAKFTYPFDLSVDVGAIGGPSAGLALTLGIINSLTKGRLTGGLHVAATGTMDLRGDVGDVGGVAQKAVAVRKAGAQVFFVPVQDAAAARSEAGSMKVYPVSSLAQVLDDLQKLGGRIPALPGGQNGPG